MNTQMTKKQIERILFDHGAEEVRNCEATFDEEAGEDGAYFWSADVLIGDRWYSATVPDYWVDGAEIDWSRSEPSTPDGGGRVIIQIDLCEEDEEDEEDEDKEDDEAEAWSVSDNGGDWDDEHGITASDAEAAASERLEHYTEQGRSVTVLRNGVDVTSEI